MLKARRPTRTTRGLLAVGMAATLMLAACSSGGGSTKTAAGAPTAKSDMPASAAPSSPEAAPASSGTPETPAAAAAGTPAVTGPSAASAPAPAGSPGTNAAAAPKTQKATASVAAGGQAPQAAPGQQAAKAQQPGSAQQAAQPQPGQTQEATPSLPGGDIPPAPGVKVPANKERQGVSDTEIKVGSQGAFDGPGAFPASFLAAKAYFRMINDQGGVNGRKFNYVFYSDSTLDNNKGMDNARRLEEQDKVFAVVAGMPWHSGDVTGPYMEKNGVPWVGDEAANYFPHMLPNAFPIGTNVGGRNRPACWHWATTDPRFKKVAMFRVNTYLADDGVAACKAAMTKAGSEIVWDQMQPFGYPDYTGEVLQAKNAGATAIYLLGPPGAFQRIVQAAQRQGWRPAFSAGPWSYSKNKQAAMGAFIDGAQFASDVPGNDDSIPEIQRYRQMMDKYCECDDVDGTGPLGWAGTRMFVEGVKALGKDVTRSRLMGYLATLRNFDTLGVTPPLTMAPIDRKGNKWTEDHKWLREPNHFGRSLIMKDGGTKQVSSSDWINVGDNLPDPQWQGW